MMEFYFNPTFININVFVYSSTWCTHHRNHFNVFCVITDWKGSSGASGWETPYSANMIPPTIQGMYSESRKMFPIRKKTTDKITIWFIIDENMSKIMKKTLISSENQKWWILCFVKMIFEGSTGVSLKSSGRRSTAVDEIYTLVVLKSWCSCWIDVKCNPGVLLFCIDFCMIWMLPKNAKTIQFFALCWFQNSFSYVFGTFSPSNSIFVDK